MAKTPKRAPKPGHSRQKKHGGGSFESERQRRFMWAVVPRAAKKWAYNRSTSKKDWVGVRRPRPTVGGSIKKTSRTASKKVTVHRAGR
jgi:hypothetical protein